MKQQANMNNVAIYLRISRDDGGDAESNSIGNQREMLRRYAKDNNLAVFSEYADDGISGTTFERPQFKRMVDDIENGKVGAVLCKDLSRLGRNNALVAYYTEIFFPQNDIRFIALNDNIDSLYGENEIMGFKSIINEYYARDISKKIRSSFKVRAQKGDFIGSYPPYGYIKNPENKHQLLLDEYSAGVVERIFSLAAQGVPARTIATKLKNDDILIPMAYLHQRTGKWGSGYDQRFPTDWKQSTVYNILKNRVYMGHMVGCKQTIKSFKNKKLENVPEENWITVPNTHEKIVDEETFWNVQKLVAIKRPPNVCGIENIFVGKLKCPDCGRNLGYQGLQGRHKNANFVCNSYRRNTKACTPHYIKYNTLYDMVLADIRKHAHFCHETKGDFDTFASQLSADRNDIKASHIKKELEKSKARSSELDAIIKKLFEQNALGVMPDDRFATLLNEYTAEQKTLNTAIDNFKSQLEQENVGIENLKRFYEMMQGYTNIQTLTTQTISDLIDRIVVNEHDGGKPRRQKIGIFYRFDESTEIEV